MKIYTGIISAVSGYNLFTGIERKNPECRLRTRLKRFIIPKLYLSDLELAELCENDCIDDNLTCLNECDSDPCKSACYRTLSDCIDCEQLLLFKSLIFFNLLCSLSMSL